MIRLCPKQERIFQVFQLISKIVLNEKILELQAQVKRFINKYLKLDGLFILLLIAQYSDVVFITDLIYGMWESHFKIEKQRQFVQSIL